MARKKAWDLGRLKLLYYYIIKIENKYISLDTNGGQQIQDSLEDHVKIS